MLGQCVYVPSSSNSQCRCLCFRASNDQYICAACNHDESYHKLNNNNNNNNNTSNDNYLSITPINNPINNSNIRDQLNLIFRPIRPENSSIASIFNPTEATGRYFSRTTNTRERGRRRFNDILNFTATVFCFTKAGESLKIPKSVGPKYEEMVLGGYIKEITFTGSNLELLNKIIQSSLSYSSRKKLYIGLLNNNEASSSSHNITNTIVASSSLYTFEFNNKLVSSSSLHNTASFESQQSDINNHELFHESDDNFENTTLEFENINAENNNNFIIFNEPSLKSSNTTDIFKNIQKFLRTQENISEKITTITFNKSDDPSIEIFNWIQKCQNETLLDIPEIKLINEVDIDASGIIHDILQNFWNILAIPDNFNRIFMAGKIFDECTTESLIIVPNSILLHHNVYYHLGRLIFWCLIHKLPFLTWLHKFHLNYIMNFSLNYNTLLQETNKTISNMVEKIQELENLISFIVKYKIITIRELELIQLYKGFNMFNSVQYIKQDYNWSNILLSLYKVVKTKDGLLQQFNLDTIFSDINKNKEIRELLFSQFWKFLNELNIKEKCQSIKWSNNFGKYNRLPYGSTCFSKIRLSENYENPITFYNDLKSVLLECSTGIYER
ncbi:hypothetical protein Glove_109g44 [Diversispora epigaea]|uniref:HECT domain-containing protein n=1 Tax=Diversispora epigaea TaxID=1348612 RepID=A0A397J2I9_9GLOM|nr:hypothetical protein Glove_109g44 [Diversispora epigaea]